MKWLAATTIALPTGRALVPCRAAARRSGIAVLTPAQFGTSLRQIEAVAAYGRARAIAGQRARVVFDLKA
jgi:hypothetical protein